MKKNSESQCPKPSAQYFDYAAATPMSQTVLESMLPYLKQQFYNPEAIYLAAKAVKTDLETARAKVAKILGVRPTEIIFTAGATEADNLAVKGVMAQFPDANCLISAIEHPAVIETAKSYKTKTVPVKNDGRLDIDQLRQLIDDKTVLVSVIYASNEIGVVEPIQDISMLIKDIRQQRIKAGNKRPLYLHTDASQAPNYLPVLVNNLGVDLMTLNAGKIYGPKQTGALFVASGVQLEAQILGGGQERNRRSGTPNLANIVGFAVALQEAEELRFLESKRLNELQKMAFEYLKQQLPEAVINGHQKWRLPNNIHLTLPGVDNERLIMELDEMGFMVAAGSACSASNETPSHVLKAIGLSDSEAQSSIRITMGRFTSHQDLSQLLKALKALTAKAAPGASK